MSRGHPGAAVKRYIVGICGASGAVYGVTLLNELLRQPAEIHVIISADGEKVMQHELKYEGRLDAYLTSVRRHASHQAARLREHDTCDFFAPPASGSFKHDGMVIAPCSVKTLAALAAGLGGNLITRAADICLKERRPLVVVPRETPISAIHLENMLRLNRAGATILPAAPGFYFGPQRIQDLVDFIVARILVQLGIEQNLTGAWGDEILV
jgi:4-hydroxy-3-polyprenylbenzoate decarboxylase